MDVDWRTITKLADIANHFADIVTKKMYLLSNNVNIHSSKQAIVQWIDDHIMSKKNAFSLQMVSVEEVLNLLKSFKSTGYDLMDNFLPSYATSQIAAPLKYIFNWSQKRGRLQLCGSMLNCVLSRKTAKNPLLLPIFYQLVYSLHSVRYWRVL